MTTAKSNRILIFLAPAANDRIASTLLQAGYDVVSVSTVPRAFDALRNEEFALAISIRPDIDLLRNIRAIPIINLEVFFHVVPGDGHSQARTRRFDRRAFLERVRFLAGAASGSVDDFSVNKSLHDASSHERRKIWTLIKGSFRRAVGRGSVVDVRLG